ncbi:MAG: preprotein translocase subunit SecE [Clostridia bacterium]|nr:preprotein translocase subunit SecE [Clostridia bacterium]
MSKEVKEKKEKKHFFKDFKAELKKVIWPSPKQLVNNTVAVITIVLITAVIVFALDFAFETINTYGVNKLKEMVDNSTANTTTENTETNSEVVENQTSNETTNTQENAGDVTNTESNAQ